MRRPRWSALDGGPDMRLVGGGAGWGLYLAQFVITRRGSGGRGAECSGGGTANMHLRIGLGRLFPVQYKGRCDLERGTGTCREACGHEPACFI